MTPELLDYIGTTLVLLLMIAGALWSHFKG